MFNNILNGKYIVCKLGGLPHIVATLCKFGYVKIGGIDYYNEPGGYVIESENNQLFVFSYDYYMRAYRDKKETNLNVLLREHKLKRILKN